MFSCHLCNNLFITSKTLIFHLRYFHFLSSTTNIKCSHNNCLQLFSNLKSFRAHLDSVHKSLECNNTTKILNDLEKSTTFSYQNSNNNDKNFETCTHEVVNDSSSICKDNIENLKNQLFNFSLYLYSARYLPRNKVILIQNSLSKVFLTLSNILNQSLDNSDNLQEILDICKNPFKDIQSEYKFLKKLQEKNIYMPSSSFVIDNIISERIYKSTPTLTKCTSTLHLMPLRFQFQALFSLPNVLKLTLQNIQLSVKNNKINNYVAGNIFKKRLEKLPYTYIIPYFLYFDEYEVNNPLGSHNLSICAAYYTFPNLPQYLLSKLEFNFVAGYVEGRNLKNLGANVTFYQLVQELKCLQETGINIKTDEGEFQVHFILGLVLGDNLGLNTVLGFVQSFNAKRFCRCCMREKKEMQADINEKSEFLRNNINYEEHLSQNDEKDTGIKENCFLHEIPHFRVTDNFCFDIMHDIFEGVCTYDLCNILISLINDKVITLDTINNRKSFFKYGESEIGNLSPKIELHKLKTYKLKMSAREMWTFLHFLPLMIGDLVPRKYRPWDLLCTLIEITDIILQTDFSSIVLDKLRKLIEVHHSLYIQLYGPLKPKHHFMVHYPTAIEKCGPLKYMWCMRFEAKHKNSKIYCNNISSRTNIPHTLSIKEGLTYSKFLNDYESGLAPEISYEKYSEINFRCMIKSEKITLTNNQFSFSTIKVVDCLHFRGNDYKPNIILTTQQKHEIQIYKIKKIFLHDKLAFVVCYKLTCKTFDKHFQSFEMTNIFETSSCHIKKLVDFSSPPLFLHKLNNGKIYLRNKTL